MGKLKSYVMDVEESAIECYISGLTLEEAIEEVSKYFDHFVSNICTEVYEVMNGRAFANLRPYVKGRK